MSEAVAREAGGRAGTVLGPRRRRDLLGTWHWDLPTDRFTVDEAFARSFRLDPALGRKGIPLAQIVATVSSPPTIRLNCATAIEAAIWRGGSYAHQGPRTRLADGRYYWLEANGRVDKAPDGTALSFPACSSISRIDARSRRNVHA